MEGNAIVIGLVIVVYLVGIFVYKKIYLPKLKGAKGEYSVKSRLRNLNKKEYIVFNDIYLKINEQSTQIDHLVVSLYGIFVIETKYYNGWIHGNENSEYWSQTFYRKKTKFRNPIKQNWAHIFLLKKVLSNFKQIKYIPIVVFAGKAELKNVSTQTPVVYKNKLIKTIRQHRTPNLSFEQVKDITNQLNEFIIKDKKIKKEHRRYVKRNMHERTKNINSFICPNCGGELVVRNGRYGEFYGCSNYPRCKFSKKI